MTYSHCGHSVVRLQTTRTDKQTAISCLTALTAAPEFSWSRLQLVLIHCATKQPAFNQCCFRPSSARQLSRIEIKICFTASSSLPLSGAQPNVCVWAPTDEPSLDCLYYLPMSGRSIAFRRRGVNFSNVCSFLLSSTQMPQP